MENDEAFKESIAYLEEISKNGKLEVCYALKIREAFAIGFRRGQIKGEANASKKSSPIPDEIKAFAD